MSLPEPPSHYRLLVGPDFDDASLISDWRRAQSLHPALQSPYFSPEFTRAVAAVRKDVRLLVLERDGQAIGFFPHQRSAFGWGRPVAGPLSDFHGLISAPDTPWHLEPALRSARLAGWSFDHLVGDTDLFAPHATGRDISPQIDLRAGYDGYVAARRAAGSDYIPKTEGLARKLAREVGELRFTLHDKAPDALAQLLAWKRAQYAESGIADAFGVRWTVALMQRLAATEGEHFAGLCSTLRAGDRLVAVHMGMRSRSVLHYWFPAYDATLAKYSAGIVLLLRIAQAAAAQGVHTIDLGRGLSQYKERLMTGSVELIEGEVMRPCTRAWLRHRRHAAEAAVARGGLAALMSWPLKALRRVEWKRRLR